MFTAPRTSWFSSAIANFVKFLPVVHSHSGTRKSNSPLDLCRWKAAVIFSSLFVFLFLFLSCPFPLLSRLSH